MAISKGISLHHAPARRVRVPIRIKITIPYLILSIILAVAAAFLITKLVLENVEERFNKQLYEAGKISSELSISYESQLLETQRLLVNVEGVAAAIQSNNPELLRSLTLGIIANDQQEAVEFLDLHGNHVLSIHHKPGGNPEEYEFSSGGQSIFTNLDIVQSVLSQKSDERGDKFIDLVQTEPDRFLYVSGSIRDAQGNLAGVVLVGRSLAKWTADMRAKTFAQISLYDHEGNVLYSTLPFPQGITPELAAQTISFKNVSSTKRNLAGERELEVASIPFAEIIGSWEVRGNRELGVLGVALSQNAVVQSSEASRWQIFLLVASANFLIILVGINLANTITHPLLQLVQASIKVSKGDLGVQVKTRTNDEISILTESFNAMVANLSQSQQDLIKAYDSTLEGWAKALELRDKETEGHSERVTTLTMRLAEALGVQGEALVNIRRGALLHDIGKMGVPDAILHKNGPLDAKEREIIQQHPQNAYNILRHIDYLQAALEIPYCHHEKWDGTGYPRGLHGEEIPASARMFAIVDVYDALTSDRPYRKAMPVEEVIAYLKSQNGSHFDPKIVKVFLHILRRARND
ncbi:MAG TPA: HD domain-containing phosphohydrolase [Anaerolineales bacterium]|nr:HD domain-containing phosphohydrolase [Anaerolineales bacterium]